MVSVARTMPIGNRVGDTIRPADVTTTPGNELPAVWTDDAAATLVWRDYERARNFVETNMWLLEWQWTDILYQSPTPDRYMANEGRPPRVPRHLVAKNTRTMATQVKRALFAEKNPFVLRPTGDTSQLEADAWTALIAALLKRMDFKYHCSLLVDTQVLQGTGLGRLVIEQREITVRRRKRKKAVTQITLPVGGNKEIPDTESDDFELVPETVTETWPRLEYRRLGTTLFDPKWCTPNRPWMSANYAIDVDFVDYYDLLEMKELSCYEGIPDADTLKRWFMGDPSASAPMGSNVEDSMSSDGSSVTHAAGRNLQTSEDPLLRPVLLIERWDDRTVKTIIEFDGRKSCIRNEEHELGEYVHVSANWWTIDNNGYGMGIGRLNGADQRINQGVTNECLKMIAYPFNAPILLDRGLNAPTQNVIARLGGFWALDMPPGGDVHKAVGFMEMPEVSPDAWRMLQVSEENSEAVSGANAPFMQGNLGGPGSSAARTASGANRIADKADDTIADPVDAVAEGVIIPTILFLVKWVKEKMPLEEIRRILKKSDAKIILNALQTEQFLDAEFEVDVLAGQRLAAKQGILKLIPFLLQITQQPQLLQFLHEKGWTVDFFEMLDLFLQMSELAQAPDIFREMTEKELGTYKQMNPVAQKVQGAAALEESKTQGKVAVVHAKGETDLANKTAELAMAKAGDGQALVRAEGLVDRGNDEKILQQGL